MKNMFFKALPLMIAASPAVAELQAMDEQNLSEISGQGGVYLSGEFAINKNGGPLWDDPEFAVGTPGTRPYYGRDVNGNLFIDNSLNPDGSGSPESCENGICGLRLAIKLNENSEGWYVLDDLSGGFSFEGLTLRTETITSAINYDYTDDGGATYSTAVETLPGNGDEVLKIGLPGKVTFNDFKFKYAVANNGEFGVPLADGTPYRQTDIFGVQLDGAVTIEGNLLLFPVE